MIKNWKFLNAVILATFSVLFSAQVFAVSFNNDFTQANDNIVDWLPLTNSATSSFPGYPCLTAGTATNNTSATSNIPGCNYTSADPAGLGSLRFTPAEIFKNSAIISNKTFPTNQGLEVTYTTYTYGGDSGGAAQAGADGMTFFMSDGAIGAQVGGVNNLGGNGGALGYSCSNGNGVYDGIEGAYLGLGMDEYGNFLNDGDNTSTGIPAQLAASATNPNLSFNSFGWGNYQPNRIGLRGAGNVRWHWLNANYPNFYPSTLSSIQMESAVKNTCQTGTLWSYADAGLPTQQNTAVQNYAAIPGGFWVLPDNQLIPNEAATTRAAAWPITYKLRITPAGLLTYLYSYNGGAYQTVLSNFPITTFNGPLPASVRFGFSAATGGSTNVHELSCFVAQPILSTSSASGNIVQGQQVKTTTKVFLASYDPNAWAGSVAAYPIVNSAGTLSVSATADWDTNCTLTGGPCQPMASGSTVPSVAAQAPSSRNLITWSGTAGIPLQWANLTASQQTILNSSDSAGQSRLSWLRGDRTKEQTATPAGNLRARTGVMGDVVNSSPTWVGPPSLNYASTFNDQLYPAKNATAPENNTLAQTYTTFADNNKTRTQIVYTGSNDGMLHGSRAGANDASGNYVSTNNDGREVLGFMPSTVLATNSVVSLTAPTYGHSYFVDAAPGYGDLFYGNAWHTWMVGGLGAGGAEVYALDITDPTSFTEANASSIVKADWTPSSLTTCVNFTNTTAPTVTNCGTSNMGNSYGTPIIRRLHNGKWAVIFGNGIGSSASSAGVFVGLVDPTTGVVSSFYWLDAFRNGTPSNPNGISYVSSADIDGDRVTDYLYGGDLQGNVWRFDLTSSNPADWRVTDFSNPADVPGTVRANPSPLFKAKDSAGAAQPITTRIAVTKTYSAGAQRVILGLATGQVSPLTNSSAATYANGTQTVYGIWDWNLSKWNGGSTTVAAVVIPAVAIPISSLSSAPSTQPIPRNLLSNTSSLLSQTATTRGLQLNTVCWQGSSACTTTNNQYGWLFDLPDTAVNGGVTTGYEQVLYSPTFSAGQLVLNTTTPPVTITGQCKPTLPTGWTMSFNIGSGGGTANSAGQVVNVLGSSTISSGIYSQVGLKLNGVGSPFIVSVGSQPNIVTQTNTGTPSIKKFNPNGGVNVKRISWEQLR